jgi:hypothetical protein
MTWLPGRTQLFQRALDLLGLATIHHFIHFKTVSPSCPIGKQLMFICLHFYRKLCWNSEVLGVYPCRVGGNKLQSWKSLILYDVLIVTEIIYGIHNFTNEASNISPNILSLSYVTSNKHRCSTRKIQPCIWTILLLYSHIWCESSHHSHHTEWLCGY